MSKPVIGVTVGTPISPNKIAEKINPVKTVNGVAPDENGNVEVATNGSTFLSQTVTLLATQWALRQEDMMYELPFEGMTPTASVICSVAPDLAMEQEVSRCMVRLAIQEDGYLWFKALNGETPTIDIDMNILVVRV